MASKNFYSHILTYIWHVQVSSVDNIAEQTGTKMAVYGLAKHGAHKRIDKDSFCKLKSLNLFCFNKCSLLSLTWTITLPDLWNGGASRNRTHVCSVKGSTGETRTPTHWNLIGRFMTAPPPVSSPRGILRPSSYHWAFIPRKEKFGAFNFFFFWLI